MASIDTTPVPASGHLPEEQDQWVGGQPVHGNQGLETLPQLNYGGTQKKPEPRFKTEKVPITVEKR